MSAYSVHNFPGQRSPANPLADELSAALEQMGLNKIDEAKQIQLLAFVDLLTKWNKIYNLTAVRTPAEMLRRHILDSLSVLPYLPAGSLLDIGTGAGLPGIPLAIVQPLRSFTLLDSAAKRIRFVQHVVGDLGLQNVEVKQIRAEDHRTCCYEMVISRAFTSVEKFLPICKPLLVDQGWCLAMTGKQQASWFDEGKWAGLQFADAQSIRLEVPGEIAERHLLKAQYRAV